MREILINTAPFEFIDILDFQLEKRVNEHVTARIAGTIHPDKESEYVEKPASSRNLVVTAKSSSGEEKILFSGLVSDVSIQYVNKHRTLVVCAVSYSYLMDLRETTRTYQNEAMTYADMTAIMGKDHPDSAFLHPEFGDRAIGAMLTQYDETNWQFAKRIASRLNTCVVADYALNYPYVSIGMPKRQGGAILHSIEHKMKKDMAEYMALSARQVPGARERDAVYYEVESREIYDLCEPVTFKDKQLYVYAAASRLEGAEIVHTYTLKEKEGFCFSETFNDKIIGASLTGRVKEVRNDAVRVEIAGDAVQSAYKWFPYSTIYSSPDGTGWYFMPEIGDIIRLHFPTEHEGDAFVISSVHSQHGNRSDPNVKHITTKYGKTVVFRPDSIFISNGAGSSIELNDNSGIRISTNSELNLTANNDIHIHGGGKIIVQGDQGVTVVQNDSVVNIDESIDLDAGHVRIR